MIVRATHRGRAVGPGAVTPDRCRRWAWHRRQRPYQRLTVCGRAHSRIAGALAQFLDADQVARRITEGAIADPVRLLGWLLDHLGPAGLQPVESAVEISGGQEDP